MDLAVFIGELLRQRGSLAVPGLGRFSQVRIHGYYDEDRSVFHPPHYETSFEELDARDTALSEYLSSRKNISVTSSDYFIDKYVSDIKKQASRETVQVDQLGWFHLNDKRLNFRPNPMPSTYEQAYFGLPELEVNKIWDQLSGFRRPQQPVYTQPSAPVTAPEPAPAALVRPAVTTTLPPVTESGPVAAPPVTAAAPVSIPLPPPVARPQPAPPATPELGIFPEVIDLKSNASAPVRAADTDTEAQGKTTLTFWIIVVAAIVIILIILVVMYRYARNASQTAILLPGSHGAALTALAKHSFIQHFL